MHTLSRAYRPPAHRDLGQLVGPRDEDSTNRPDDETEWPEDRAWVAFTLRPQARFHDGTPFTVEDVIWTFDTLKAKGLPNYAFYYGDVLKAEKTGDRKVLFTFRDNTNKELPLILGQLPVLPSKWWEPLLREVSPTLPSAACYKVDFLRRRAARSLIAASTTGGPRTSG